MKTLVLFAHPRTDRSEVNLPMAAAAKTIPGVSFVDLYAEYPTFDVDIDREQQRLLDHDAIVFQHPFYWYSVPAMLKEWQDLVLEHGFAYGHGGEALKGKVTVNVLTAGAQREMYRASGGVGHEIRDLLLPWQATAHLCQMRYLAPFTLYGAGRAKIEDRTLTHVDKYSRLLKALVGDRIDLDAAEKATCLDAVLDAVIRPQGDA